MGSIPFLWTNYSGNNSGHDFNLFGKYVSGDSKGININGIGQKIKGDSKAIDFSGIFNIIGRDAEGIYLAGIGNDFTRSRNFLIQCSILGNKLGYTHSEEDFVFQVGLSNRIGNQTGYLINIHGLKNIGKAIKKNFFKNKNLERNLED